MIGVPLGIWTQISTRFATKSGIKLVPHPVTNWHELVRNLVPRLVPNLVMDLVPDLVPDQMPNLPLERLPDLVPCLVHTRYKMVLGAVAASEQSASKGADGMGEAFRSSQQNTN